MSRILIIYAHPEPKSFGRALLEEGIAALEGDDHEVRISDLYAGGFDPIARGDDFTRRRFPDRLQYDREQKHAVTSGSGFSADIAHELEKLFWCDTLILQFPLWWWSVPAIMKGWIDRVFVNGAVYGAGMRLEQGGLRGKRAMLAFTTGCYPEMVGGGGLLGNLEASLWHLHSGTFHYAGLTVLPPFVGWKLRYSDADAHQATLAAYRDHLGRLDELAPLNFHETGDFGADWQLRQDVSPLVPAYAREGWRL